MIGKINEALPSLRLLDCSGSGQECIQVPVFVNEEGRGFDANPRDSRHVVRRIAGQGLDVHHFFRTHPEFFLDFRAADFPIFNGVEHADSIRNQLHQIFIRGHDADVHPRGFGLSCVGGDQVIGFKARCFETFHVERARGLSNQGKLRNEFVGRVGAIGLIVGRQFIPKRRPCRIENDGQMRGLQIIQQFQQHVAEPEHGVDGSPVGSGQHRQRVERSKDEAGPIHQTEVLTSRILVLRVHRCVPSPGLRLSSRRPTWGKDVAQSCPTGKV